MLDNKVSEYEGYLLEGEKVLGRYPKTNLIISIKQREFAIEGTLRITTAQTFFSLPTNVSV